MNVSSRTPEGIPSECPLCGASTNIEFSDPAGDAPCPNCGCLLWESVHILDTVKKHYGDSLGTSPDQITVDTRFDELGADSLDTVEMVMELEGEFDINIRDDAAENIQTIGDVVRYVERYRRGKHE